MLSTIGIEPSITLVGEDNATTNIQPCSLYTANVY